MRETSGDLVALQATLDDSFDAAGAHLRSIFDEDSRLTAQELVDAVPGILEVHLGVATSDGAPLVAPVDAILFRGLFWIGLPEPSVRARLVRRDPRVSMSYARESFAVIVHGRLVETGDGHARTGFDQLAKQLYVAQHGPAFEAWFDEKMRTQGPGLVGYVEPRALFAKR